MSKVKYINRELSWLAFNHRVLQEALDPSVPVEEKIKFMGIFSNNLDEFFRVRVASFRNLLLLKNKTQKKLNFDPSGLLKEIHNKVQKQQEELGHIFREIVIKELSQQDIHLIDENNIPEDQIDFIREYYQQELSPYLKPVILVNKGVKVFLNNKSIYLTVRFSSKNSGDIKSRKGKYALIEIPSKHCGRFVELPTKNKHRYVMFIDDIIRYNLPDIFYGFKVESSYEIKLTRDAELYIDDEFSGDLLAKIKKGVAQRKIGVPSRFLYDSEMPGRFLKFLTKMFSLTKQDLIPGGRYHNFNDFMDFPQLGPKEFRYNKLTPLPAPDFLPFKTVLSAIKSRDILVHYPYQKYDYIINFLQEAIVHKQTKTIYITLYRVAADSRIVRQLIRAANIGIEVIAFVEVKARFDEESNFHWANEMSAAGIKVLYSFPGLKVHAKLCLVHIGSQRYAYLATGNFNEKTALIYTDFGMFTRKAAIVNQVQEVFDFLTGKKKKPVFRELLVAPFNMRDMFEHLIDVEIDQAKQGNKAEIILKLNNLEDIKMIKKLYKAASAGVEVTIIVRSICCLVPSQGIQVFSIVDRFLEHTRVFIFHNAGHRKYYLASADWMRRNLSRRIEVAFPVQDRNIKLLLNTIIDYQINDNSKMRIIDVEGKNKYRTTGQKNKINAQLSTYHYLQKLASVNKESKI